MTKHFQQSKFSSEEGQISPSEHFESAHSPSLSYTFIEKSLASIDAGLDDFDDEERMEAEIYSNVTVFREVMQFIEEFGIYFYSRLDPEVDFVEAITGTRPRQVKEIFESIRDEEFGEVVEEYRDDLDADEWLKNQFGYDKLEAQIEDLELEDLLDEEHQLSVDSVKEAIEVSVQTIRTHLKKISTFFLRFDEPYNAIKHGNRVFPLSEHGFTLESPDLDLEADVDEPYVTFLCKSSGDRRGGNRYTFTAPVRILREQAVAIAKLARNLYTQMYDIKQKVEESVRTGEEVSLNPNLYGIDASAGDSQEHSLKTIENPDTTIWLPEGAVPSDIEEYELPYQNQIAVGLKAGGDDLVVVTEGDSTPSYDYPILVDAEMGSDLDHLQGMKISQNFSFKMFQLPLWQYLELQSLSELEPIEKITLRHEPTGKSDTRPTDQPISLPSLPDPDFPVELEYMRNVGRASQREIWLPVYWPPRVVQVVEHYRENFDLTRDVAQNLLADIDALTEEDVATIPEIVISETDIDEDDNEVPVRKRDTANLVPGGIVLELDEDTGHCDFQLVSGRDPRYERLDVGDQESILATMIRDTPEKVFEEFTERGMDGVLDVDFATEREEMNAVLEVKRRYGPKRTWWNIDHFVFILYEEFPPHLEADID